MMNLSLLKKNFTQQLKNELPPTEIEAAFHLLSEKYLNPLESGPEPGMELNATQLTKFEKALARLKKNEPIEYILEEINFFGRPFEVNSDVHVPRRETETLINWVLEDFETLTTNKTEMSLLDIGTGSGILPITFAKELPQLRVSAIDISEKALNVAHKNAIKNAAEVEFLKADVLQMESLPKKFDILVSNPPYILKFAQKDVQRKILGHEPPVALYIEDGDPMIFNRKIAQLAKNSLAENGAVYVEINQFLGAETAQIFANHGFRTELRKDVFGNERTLKAFR